MKKWLKDRNLHPVKASPRDTSQKGLMKSLNSFTEALAREGVQLGIDTAVALQGLMNVKSPSSSKTTPKRASPKSPGRSPTNKKPGSKDSNGPSKKLKSRSKSTDEDDSSASTGKKKGKKSPSPKSPASISKSSSSSLNCSPSAAIAALSAMQTPHPTVVKKTSDLMPAHLRPRPLTILKTSESYSEGRPAGDHDVSTTEIVEILHLMKRSPTSLENPGSAKRVRISEDVTTEVGNELVNQHLQNLAESRKIHKKTKEAIKGKGKSKKDSDSGEMLPPDSSATKRGRKSNNSRMDIGEDDVKSPRANSPTSAALAKLDSKVSKYNGVSSIANLSKITSYDSTSEEDVPIECLRYYRYLNSHAQRLALCSKHFLHVITTLVVGIL